MASTARLRRDGLIPNQLSYPELVTVSRNDDLIPRPIWTHKHIRMGMGHWTWVGSKVGVRVMVGAGLGMQIWNVLARALIRYAYQACRIDE